MPDRPTEDDAPEFDPILENAEQDDEGEQSHTLADEALRGDARRGSPLDSEKVGSNDDDDSTQDLIDHMRDMEQSGRIDMGAFAGEPNMDDEDDRYGAGHDPDDD